MASAPGMRLTGSCTRGKGGRDRFSAKYSKNKTKGKPEITRVTYPSRPRHGPSDGWITEEGIQRPGHGPLRLPRKPADRASAPWQNKCHPHKISGILPSRAGPPSSIECSPHPPRLTRTYFTTLSTRSWMSDSSDMAGAFSQIRGRLFAFRLNRPPKTTRRTLRWTQGWQA